MSRTPSETAWRVPGKPERTVNPRTLRAIWAHLSAHPRATRREVSAATGAAYGHVNNAIDILHAAGYIRRAEGTARGVVVLVPFIAAR